MFDRTDTVLNIESFHLEILQNVDWIYIPMQNSYFDSVNQPLLSAPRLNIAWVRLI
jgi:hypothetical protein